MSAQVTDRSSLHRYRTEIPNIVDDMDLSPYAFRLYVHLLMLHQNGHRDKQDSSRSLAKACQMSVGKIGDCQAELISAGILHKSAGLSPGDAVRFLQQKQGQIMPLIYGIPHLVCAWCKATSILVESHHYPVPRREGGEETVEICPNCHREFHALTRPSFRLTAFGLTGEK